LPTEVNFYSNRAKSAVELDKKKVQGIKGLEGAKKGPETATGHLKQLFFQLRIMRIERIESLVLKICFASKTRI
jgi:hypothetical protein